MEVRESPEKATGETHCSFQCVVVDFNLFVCSSEQLITHANCADLYSLITMECLEGSSHTDTATTTQGWNGIFFVKPLAFPSFPFLVSLGLRCQVSSMDQGLVRRLSLISISSNRGFDRINIHPRRSNCIRKNEMSVHPRHTDTLKSNCPGKARPFYL